MALVAAAGFYHTPMDAYQRPNMDVYPQDTIASHYHRMLDYLWDPKRALLVIEDDYNKNEDTKLYHLYWAWRVGRWFDGQADSFCDMREGERQILVGEGGNVPRRKLGCLKTVRKGLA